MPNYKGRRPRTRRIVIWARGKSHEWIVEGTKKDGDAFEARKRLELEANVLSTRTAPTFSDFCEHQYKPFAETNLEVSTWSNVRVYQLATLREFFGTMRLTDISAEDVEGFKRVRLRSVAASTVNNELKLLGYVLAHAADVGYPTSHPKIVKLKQLTHRRVAAWTTAELDRLFAELRVESVDLMRMVVFLANTGCRKGEALAAEWDWIDFDAEMIRIPANEYWRPKNGKPREVPMSDACRAVLAGPKVSERWVFPKASGERYAVFPKNLFAAARKRAKLSGGPHALRHNAESRIMPSGSFDRVGFSVDRPLQSLRYSA